jgi:hypothetical protein
MSALGHFARPGLVDHNLRFLTLLSWNAPGAKDRSDVE